jgi:hypothetical protein
MPATSDAQANLFRYALAMKKGKTAKVKGPAKRIAETLAASKIKEFTQKADQ